MTLLAAVAAVIPTRTVDDAGVAGAFSPSTIPTDAQVAEVISQVEAEVVAALGGEGVPVELAELYSATVATGAAWAVELSYYPAAPGSDGGAGLRIRYEAMLRRLVEDARRRNAGGRASHWAFPAYHP